MSKSLRTFTTTAFVTLILCGGANSHAAAKNQCDALFKPTVLAESFSDGELKDIIATNGRSYNATGFFTTRGVQAYVEIFGDLFRSTVERLGPNDAVLDAGCGDAFLSDAFFPTPLNLMTAWTMFVPMAAHLMDGTSFRFTPGQEPAFVALTKELRKRSFSFFRTRLATGRFKLLKDRYFEEYSDLELKQGKSVRVITDFFGVLSYTERIDLVMQTYLRILERDGVIFIGAEPLTMISQIGSFYGFLTEIKGISIQYHRGADPEGNLVYGYEIRKTDEAITLPELKYVASDYGVPPTRFYEKTGRVLRVRK